MKVKLGAILGSREGLIALQKSPLNAATSFKIAKTVRELDAHVKDYEAVRVSKIKEMGTEQEDKSWVVNAESVDVFNEEMLALMDKDIDVKIEAVKLVDLKRSNGDMIDIEPMYLLNLEWLIKE